jgi:hypothetical protein
MAPPEDTGRTVTPIAAILQQIDKGNPHVKASVAFADAYAAVHERGGKAEVTIKLTIKPAAKGNLDQLAVTAEVGSKVPQDPPRPSIFFFGRDGNPSRDDPEQLSFDGMRVVEAAETKVVGGDA